MKERTSVNANGITPSQSSGSSSSTNANSSNDSSNNNNNAASSSSNTATPVDPTKSFLSPLNSQNFMAPPIGGLVRCVLCLGNVVQGKVIAYDQQTRMLALRSPSPNKPGCFDFNMVNLSWCSNLELIEEASEPPETLPNLNTRKLDLRKKLNIDHKFKKINTLNSEASPLAQHLYFFILNTINEVEWRGTSIVVMKAVIIEPPYDVQSCRNVEQGKPHKALDHVKKIVKKFNEEYATMNTSSSTETNSSSSTTTTASASATQ